MKFQKPPKKGEKRMSAEVFHDHDGDEKGSASEAQTDSASSFPENGSRKASFEEVQFVHNLIERCMQLHMTKDEVVKIIENRVKIDPGFTTLVWQKLEEENPEFFNAYYVRLKLKKQITIFNQLLEQQYQLSNCREQHTIVPTSMHNGLLHMPVNSSMGYPAQQLPSVPSKDPAHMEPLCYGSSHHVVHGAPAMGNFYPIQPNIYAGGGIKQEIAESYPSTEASGQFPFQSDEIMRMGIHPVTFDATFPSNMFGVEGFQLAPDGVSLNPGDNLSSDSVLMADLTNFEDLRAIGNCQSSITPLSDMDFFIDSPDQGDIVDEFIAEAPFQDFQKLN